MRKRPRASDTDADNDVSEFLGSSDGSYCEASKARSRTVPSKRSKTASKRARGVTRPPIAASSTSTRVTHPTSWHVVVRIDPIRKSLLDWYWQIHELRGMPWRKTFDHSLDKDGRAQRAYEVWVSEIMLQQTQVTTVIPYYQKWMVKFPTIRDLAKSDIDTVNSLWKGLGYYSRAARLLSGAQKVVKELEGRLPDNAKDMQAKIPGIGRYSAGAVCSIAYNQRVPVLDGNVTRLLTRFLSLYAPPKAKQAQDILWAGAEAFVEGSSHPGDINQALIELGSTVCKVKDPACGDCPLRPWCRAYQRIHDSSVDEEEADIEELCAVCEQFPIDDPDIGSVIIYPMKVERKKAREELDSVNVIEWCTEDSLGRYFLLVRRPEGGLLAGLYEFPTVPNISGTYATAAKVAEIPADLLRGLLVDPSFSNSKPRGRFEPGGSHDADDTNDTGAMRIVHVKPAGDVVHVFSHIRKTYRIQWVLLKGGGNEPPRLQKTCESSTGRKIKAKRRTRHRNHSLVSEDSEASESTSPDVARWVPLDQVEHANIGTGVTKVWKLVQALW